MGGVVDRVALGQDFGPKSAERRQNSVAQTWTKPQTKPEIVSLDFLGRFARRHWDSGHRLRKVAAGEDDSSADSPRPVRRPFSIRIQQIINPKNNPARERVDG
jgi:hypothetical protein